MGVGRLVIGIVGSNPAEDKDVYPRLSVLCCPMKAEALRRADPPVQRVLSDVKLIHNYEMEQVTTPNL